MAISVNNRHGMDTKQSCHYAAHDMESKAREKCDTSSKPAIARARRDTVYVLRVCLLDQVHKQGLESTWSFRRAGYATLHSYPGTQLPKQREFCSSTIENQVSRSTSSSFQVEALCFSYSANRSLLSFPVCTGCSRI